ncbi:unnamed protein product [Eretmochelys imbricata]
MQYAVWSSDDNEAFELNCRSNISRRERAHQQRVVGEVFLSKIAKRNSYSYVSVPEGFSHCCSTSSTGFIRTSFRHVAGPHPWLDNWIVMLSYGGTSFTTSLQASQHSTVSHKQNLHLVKQTGLGI